MYFRPYPVLTLFAIPAMAALIALGVWQSQRAAWKAGQIAGFEAAAGAEPAEAQRVLCGGEAREGVVVAPPVPEGGELRVFGHDAAGDAGWRLFRVSVLPCGPVLVETGFDMLAIGGPGGAFPRKASAPAERFIVSPWPGRPLMAAGNAADRNEWYWFDPPAMAQALGKRSLNPNWILVPLTGMPDFLTRTPPETHVGYAVTWFGMAAAFGVIYALFHARAGRLRFRKVPAQK